MRWIGKVFGKDTASPAERAEVADLNTAIALYRQRKYDDALRIADTIIAAGPGVALGWRFRGECLFRLARYTDAVQAFDKAPTIDGRGCEDIFLWAALSLDNAGERDQARSRLKQALAGNLAPELRARTAHALKQLEDGP